MTPHANKPISLCMANELAPYGIVIQRPNSILKLLDMIDTLQKESYIEVTKKVVYHKLDRRDTLKLT
jgi:hypothetical protein